MMDGFGDDPNVSPTSIYAFHLLIFRLGIVWG
jgi:hypothetical protein